jgi:hypothetical protein
MTERPQTTIPSLELHRLATTLRDRVPPTLQGYAEGHARLVTEIARLRGCALRTAEEILEALQGVGYVHYSDEARAMDSAGQWTLPLPPEDPTADTARDPARVPAKGQV